jgi:hypothetical protein
VLVVAVVEKAEVVDSVVMEAKALEVRLQYLLGTMVLTGL